MDFLPLAGHLTPHAFNPDLNEFDVGHRLFVFASMLLLSFAALRATVLLEVDVSPFKIAACAAIAALAQLCSVMHACATPLGDALVRANSKFESRGTLGGAEETIRILRETSFPSGTISEQYVGHILMTRALMWQINPIYLYDTPITDDDEKVLAIEANKSVQSALKLEPKLGEKPCDAKYYAAVLRVASGSDDPEFLRETIRIFDSLRGARSISGVTCEFLDDAGIDRYVGRTYYRLSRRLTPGPRGKPIPKEAREAWERSKSHLRLAHERAPQNEGNVLWYAYALMAVLAGEETDQGKADGCLIILEWGNSPTPDELAGLNPYLSGRKQAAQTDPLCH